MHVKRSNLKSTKSPKPIDIMAPVYILEDDDNQQQPILPRPPAPSLLTAEKLTPSPSFTKRTQIIQEYAHEDMPTMAWPLPPTPLPPLSSQMPPPLPQISLLSSSTPHCIVNDALLNAQDTLAKAAQDIPPAPTAPTKCTKYVYTACEPL